ncbi:hypothetical protein L207DRAFT_528174 [Hyaloscypha variabilis F]|uniref:Uncharacterized protein n=1 Tax=Hyaloscypha variabilis (strain UAMH 11265 / GT02V1 / F) TaxID=1149755 RepID=A0A2J6RSX9_HYAVF|nr:hypothetical protein L207DRAFT_528174 [Hyaloscypha variabilis F]
MPSVNLNESYGTLSSNAVSTTQKSQNAEAAETNVSEKNSGESGDLDSLFGDDQDELSQEVMVDGEAAENDTPSTSRASEGTERSDDVGRNGSGGSDTTQLHAVMADAGSYISFKVPHVTAQPTKIPQAPNPRLQPLETATKLAALVKSSTLTFPQVPIQQSVEQILQRNFQDCDNKASQQPESRIPFGPSHPHHLIPAAKRGPKPKLPPVPVLRSNTDPRYQQRLDAGVRHIREFIKSKNGAAGPVPQDSKLVRKMESVQKVMSSQEWRAYLERKIWEDGRQPTGSNSASMVPPPHIGQGLADDVDAAMPEFVKQVIRAERAGECNSKSSSTSSVPSPSQSQGVGSYSSTSYGVNHPRIGDAGQYPRGNIAPACGQPQFGNLPNQSMSNFESQSNAAPPGRPIDPQISGVPESADIFVPSIPQMMMIPNAHNEPNPGFAARHPPPLQYVAAPSSYHQSQLQPTEKSQPQPVSVPPVANTAGIPSSGSQMLSHQAQQTTVTPSSFQQTVQLVLSPRGQAALNAWESEYFAHQDRMDEATLQTFGCLMGNPRNPTERQKERNYFRMAFYQNVAEFGEEQYIDYLLQKTQRHDMFGSQQFQQSSGIKRRAGDAEGEQDERETKRGRQY